MTDGGRPQDQGRAHRGRGRPSAATASLLARYQQAMRDELEALLQQLEGTLPDPGLLDDPKVIRIRIRPPIAERVRLWELAVKLGRELGTQVDVIPPDSSSAAAVVPPRRPRASRPDFGGA